MRKSTRAWASQTTRTVTVENEFWSTFLRLIISVLSVSESKQLKFNVFFDDCGWDDNRNRSKKQMYLASEECCLREESLGATSAPEYPSSCCTDYVCCQLCGTRRWLNDRIRPTHVAKWSPNQNRTRPSGTKWSADGWNIVMIPDLC